nr:delta(3,5)-Delta(2,4)-dienoyl-CoA isomerase, mitochondrial [Pelodiscus sinensis]|eukprot:XP_006130873.1 delta(3,5)-Delta(2,4)-dienoyl-CoA isomerase, mitochondrial [Pelodiscus sinensis]
MDEWCLSSQSCLPRSGRCLASEPAAGGAPAAHSYETLAVSRAREKVLHVELNRPDKRNAMNAAFWREMVECFSKIAQDPECHAVVVSGAGKLFTAGIDLMEMGSVFVMMEGDDTARKAWNIRRKIREYQETFSVLEKCPKPVIAAVHGACIGGGVDLISACDIRYCTQDAWFQVKVRGGGRAADVGPLQRLPRIIGNRSLVNELAFTARRMQRPGQDSGPSPATGRQWPALGVRTAGG